MGNKSPVSLGAEWPQNPLYTFEGHIYRQAALEAIETNPEAVKSIK